MRDPAASIFCRPVDPSRDKEDFTIQEYRGIISKPMDLGTVMRKFRAGAYDSAQQMREDVVLVWRNCYDFNGPDNAIYDRALGLSERFDEHFQATIKPPFHDRNTGLAVDTAAYVGRRVKVYWRGEHSWFPGTIDQADQAKVILIFLWHASACICIPSLLRRPRRGLRSPRLVTGSPFLISKHST